MVNMISAVKWYWAWRPVVLTLLQAGYNSCKCHLREWNYLQKMIRIMCE